MKVPLLLLRLSFVFVLVLILFSVDQQAILNQISSGVDFNYDEIINKFGSRFDGGIKLTDIEDTILLFVFIRCIILTIRYNLKTSISITVIGLIAGYLWYRHFIDILTLYGELLSKVPYLQGLGVSAVELEDKASALEDTYIKLGSQVGWDEPGRLLYFAFTKGITSLDERSNLSYYIDPISMFISILPKEKQDLILPSYYKIYNDIIPQVFDILSEFWGQLSGVCAYALITRVGKRYCPYLIRWHWTLLLLVEFMEPSLLHFIFRLMYFQQYVIDQALVTGNKSFAQQDSLILQTSLIDMIFTFCVVAHLAFLVLAMFHALCGQYFYLPFFVECIELNIGRRPKNSIYSGGKTSWQDQKRANQIYPKIWYGWFGRGTTETLIFSPLKRFLINNIKRFISLFKR